MSTNGLQEVHHISRPITVTLGSSDSSKMLNAAPIVPPAKAMSDVLPTPTKYRPAGTIPNTPFYASFISWSLGGLFWTSLICGIATLVLREGWIPGVSVEAIFGTGRWTRCIRPQLGLYLASWALFHVLEFWTTAACNKEKLSVDGEYEFVSRCVRCLNVGFVRSSFPAQQRSSVSHRTYHRPRRVLHHRLPRGRQCSLGGWDLGLQEMVDEPRIAIRQVFSISLHDPG